MDENIRIDFQEKDGFFIITPRTKELTYKNSKSFLSVSKHNITGESVRAILNCEHIEIIDSMSLGTLMALLKHVRKTGGDLVVTALSEPINDLFKLLNFTAVFRCFPSVEEAMARY